MTWANNEEFNIKVGELLLSKSPIPEFPVVYYLVIEVNRSYFQSITYFPNKPQPLKLGFETLTFPVIKEMYQKVTGKVEVLILGDIEKAIEEKIQNTGLELENLNHLKNFVSFYLQGNSLEAQNQT